MPYLIDGNNLLGSWKRPRSNADDRTEVVRRVAAFCRARGARATLVFDGSPIRADLDRQILGSVEILYPPRGQDADSVIRRILNQTASASEIIVVTSDRPLYSYAKTRGAAILRAHEWNNIERRVLANARHDSIRRSEKPEREPNVEYWLSQFKQERPK
ncbi:MAG: NYN domain-containing protein [Vicinamibacteria bacterium]|nr:NYN domain-containing protein [Vicinamibacteria bacterium]